MNSIILYEKEITVNAIDSAYEKGKKDGSNSIIEELEKIKAEFEEDRYILLNQTVAIQIMDKYISELKEEINNE